MLVNFDWRFMKRSQETLFIGVVLLCLMFFGLGAIFVEKILGSAQCKDYMDIFNASGAWASAVGTFAAAFVALRIAGKQNKMSQAVRMEDVYFAFCKIHAKLRLESRDLKPSVLASFYTNYYDALSMYFPDITKQFDRFYENTQEMAGRVARNEKILNDGLLSKVLTGAKDIEREMFNKISDLYQ